MREKRGGYGPVVSIGYRTQKNSRGKIDGKNAVMINNLKEMSALKAGEIILLGKIGKKKKLEIAQKAKEKNIRIYNLKIDKFLKNTGKKKPEEKAK